MIDKFNLLFVTFFNLGKLKYAPGTLASIVTCLIFFLAIKIISYELLAILIVLIFSYSIISIKNTKKYFKSKDPKEIVIDEVVGQSLPLLFIPVFETLYPFRIEFYIILAFIFFRIFDISKPFPIGYIDKNLSGAMGIMLDDILAGLYTIFIIATTFYFVGGL